MLLIDDYRLRKNWNKNPQEPFLFTWNNILLKKFIRRSLKKKIPIYYFVYLVQDGEFYKIGVTNKLDTRLSTMQTNNPREIKLIHTLQFTNSPSAYAIENSLHQKFSSKHIRREWFQLDQKDIEYIKNLHNIL